MNAIVTGRAVDTHSVCKQSLVYVDTPHIPDLGDGIACSAASCARAVA